jgi:hypothetical protein
MKMIYIGSGHRLNDESRLLMNGRSTQQDVHS